MKQAPFDQQIHPALEREELWRKGDLRPFSKREKIEAISVHLLRLIFLFILLLGVLNS
ncbi:MAG: hypothetical protein RBS53_08450 [Bacteroidales bacterium]|jgi:hypothetical protein|nr:hypothetical protein [Bacteroidales bacterium]NLM93274.1 hypothetical protein [Bacteroidales bacterium]